ncbi:MAG: antitoxin MazE-like protein [Anaerolineales bacterium]
MARRPASSRADCARARRYRERMRAAGLRTMQMWVPDTRTPSFPRKLRRQVALLRGRPE